MLGRLADVMSGVRRHLQLPLHGDAVASIESWRRTWDPVMANVVPAHATLVYPEETPDEELLLDRAGTECGIVSEFRLRLGSIFVDDDGRGGVFVTVDDIDGGWLDLRRYGSATSSSPRRRPRRIAS